MFYLTDRVEDAGWLPADEKQWLTSELRKEADQMTAAGRVNILAAFRHPQTLQLMAVFFLIVTGNQAILFFLPSIANNIKSLSVTWQTVVTILPYLCSVLGIFLNGYLSARTSERRWHTAAPILMAGFALGLAILAKEHLAIMVACLCLVGLSFQAYLPVFWTLPGCYLGKSASAVAIGAINSVGNLGGFTGPYLFGFLKTATGRFESGLWILTGCMLTSGLLASRIRIENHCHEKIT